MAVVRLDDDFVDSVKLFAKAESRSLSRQIQHWANIGKMVEENPDLTYQFIRDTLIAKAELEQGNLIPYKREKD